jgi:UPF0716 family protein affecting phage T7 exclusion
MKKFKNAVCLVVAAAVLSSCATVFGGRVNTYQRTKPRSGEPQRRMRVGAFIADILLFWPGAIVDFATCAIYKPVPAPEDATPPATPVAEKAK